jgi:hypothetical protein
MGCDLRVAGHQTRVEGGRRIIVAAQPRVDLAAASLAALPNNYC